MEFVVIHGRRPSHVTSDIVLREYIQGIVYGTPSRIFATIVRHDSFVALVEYEGNGDSVAAPSTFARLSSFSYGGDYTLDSDVAWREFGTWVAHYSGVTKPHEVAASRRLIENARV